MPENNIGDVLTGNAPFRISIESDDVTAALKDNAPYILISLFILIVLSILVANALTKVIFKG